MPGLRKILMTATVCGVAALLNGQNLLQDTDFQPNECGEYGCWSMYLMQAQDVERLPQASPSKLDALRLDVSRTSDLIHGGINLVPSAKYRFGGYVCTENFHAADSGFLLRDCAQYYWSRNTAKFPETTNGKWVKIETSVTVPKQRISASLFLVHVAKATGILEISEPFLEAEDDVTRQGTSVSPSIVHTWNRIMPFSPILSEIPAGRATLQLTIYTKLEKPVTEYECQVEIGGQSRRFPLNGMQFVTAEMESLEPGHQLLKLQLLQKADGRLLLENTYPCTVVLPKTFDVHEKWLNNLVSELARLPLTDGELSFTVPRDGWYWFGLDRADEGTEILLDNGLSPIIRHRQGERSETMRNLTAGKHRLVVRGTQKGNSITIRSVKQLMCFPMNIPEGDNIFTQLRKCGRYYIYDLPFFTKHIWPTVNTQLLQEQYYTPEGVPPRLGQECRDRGIRLISSGSAKWDDPEAIETSVRTGKCIQFTEGRALDELGYWWTFEKQKSVAEGLWRVIDFKKQVYLWMAKVNGYVRYPIIHRPLMAASFNSGLGQGRILLETYITTSKDQESTEKYMNYLNEHIRHAESILPGSTSRLAFMFSGYLSAGVYDVNCHPQTDIKWTMDYFLWKIANDPELKGIFGTGFYDTNRCDEEYLRWAGALMRHYCVEGQRGMLSSKFGFTCNPDHLRNCDFDDGLQHWTARPAQSDTILPWHRSLYGRNIQQRVNEGNSLGDHAALFVRCDNAPNKLTQKATGLTPGRQYVLRFITADPDELNLDKGMSIHFAFHAEISNSRLLPELGREYRCLSKHEIVNHKVVFIPNGTEADITFSDWRSDDEAGAPKGQRRLLNFINLTPYFAP